MTTGVPDLTTTDGLRSACETVGRPENWSDQRSRWMRQVADAIGRVRSADERERATREFQEWLWESNQIAAVGQGNISVDRALDSSEFRAWFAARSVEPIPAERDERLRFLSTLYRELRDQLAPFLDKKVPHLKMARVLAALFPESMTTVASGWALMQLVRAMGGPRGLEPVERHFWARERLDAVLGPAGPEADAQAERMTLVWLLYANFVQSNPEQGLPDGPENTPEPVRLVPLPPARRRRGMTAIKGLFQGVLSTLEFVRPGVTREELIDFLRASSPETKVSSLGVAINAFQGELGVIRLVGDRYVLTEQGENALESQDATYLADWLLTRILGVDRALVELRDRGALPPSELLSVIQSMNPGWTSSFTAQAIVSWLRSMGVIETNEQSKHALTSIGAEWAARIHWAPEPLPKELGGLAPTPPVAVFPRSVVLPSLGEVIASVQSAGHFPADLIARLHIGLWSHTRRHFAILTGLSGSGKTLLARKYGAALASGKADEQLLTLPVQPGWYDPGALLGYTNPLRGDAYVRTSSLEFLLAASGDPERPYVLVLDEMNLSHPEQYMAPLLSAMETGEAIALHTEGEFFDGIPGSIPYPSNLVVIGTVNMDETTHGLSDKVLDRAFVLEFWAVDLDSYPRWGDRGIRPESEQRARDLLGALMQALAPARLHFGWRVVDDVLDFLKRAEDFDGTLSVDAALDGLVYAKVLPKLRGEDTQRLRQALTSCELALERFGLSSSRTKVGELLADVKTTGSARFWR